MRWTIPRAYCNNDQRCINTNEGYDLYAFFYMHILFMLLHLILAVLIVISILIGLHVFHKKIVLDIRLPHVERPREVLRKDDSTMTEGLDMEQRSGGGTIYTTRAGSVYHIDPGCDQGGNLAPMSAKRQCLLCKASHKRRG